MGMFIDFEGWVKENILTLLMVGQGNLLTKKIFLFGDNPALPLARNSA